MSSPSPSHSLTRLHSLEQVRQRALAAASGQPTRGLVLLFWGRHANERRRPGSSDRDRDADATAYFVHVQNAVQQACANKPLDPFIVDVDTAHNTLLDYFYVATIPMCIFVCMNKWSYIVHDMSGDALQEVAEWITAKMSGRINVPHPKQRERLEKHASTSTGDAHASTSTSASPRCGQQLIACSCTLQ